jgi:FkbM family methyltransferase
MPPQEEIREQVSDRGSFFATTAPYSPYLGVVTSEGRYVMPTNDQLGRGLFSKRARPEFRVLARSVAIVEALIGADAVADRQFIDVGANIGTTTIPALLVHQFGSAVACEPEAENFRVLRANIALNELEERTRSLQVAVSNRTGHASLVVVEGGSQKGWIALDPAQIREFEKSRTKAATHRDEALGEPSPMTVSDVKLVTLDGLAEDGIVDVDRVGMLWVDAEGHEAHILEGASALTERGIPIVFEFYPAGMEEQGGRQKLSDVAEDRYTHFVEVRRPEVEVDGPARKVRPVADLPGYAERFLDPGSPVPHTDLLLLRLGAAQARKGADLASVVRLGERKGTQEPFA